MTPQPHHIEKLFPELCTYTDDQWRALGTDRPTVMIAMTARTGSSHLCSSLESIFDLGRPSEIFNARDFLSWKKESLGLERYEDFLKPYIDEGRDFVCFKTNWIDFEFFADKVHLMFPNLKYVYLERIDVAAQGVSLFKAVVSKVWHNSPNHAKAFVPDDPEVAAQFDIGRISQSIRSIEREKTAWEKYFFEVGLQPVRLFYDLFADDIRPAVQTLIDHLDLPKRDVNKITSDYSKLSDSISDAWLAAIHEYRSGRGPAAASAKPPLPRQPLAQSATPEFYTELLQGGSLGGLRLPKWPDEATQQASTGASGLTVLRHATNFASALEKDGAFSARDWRGLDFGCGWGQIAAILLLRGSASQLDICDHSAQMIEMCQTAGYRNRAFVVPYTLQDGDLPDAEYDFCYASNIFGHYDRDMFENNLHALVKSVKRGGRVYFAVRHQSHIDNLIKHGKLPADTTIPEDGFAHYPRSEHAVLGETAVSQAYLTNLAGPMGQIELIGPVDVKKHLYRLVRTP